MAQIVGKVMRKNAEVITIFKVDDKHYPADEYNSQIFETYLHTGNKEILSKLENEITEV